MPYRSRLLFVIAGLLTIASTASGQVPFETSGARALGMGGAFVGVADDASATSWNPAGLPQILYADAAIELGRVESEGPGSGLAADTAGWRLKPTRIAVATPVLAFTYERLRFAGVPVPGASPGGADEGPQETPARTLQTQHFGITLVQSVGDALVVGSTLRVVRAGTAEGAAGPGEPVRDVVSRIAQLDVDHETHFDADIGVLGWIGRFRLGLVVRNVTAPTVDAGSGDDWDIERQVRVGASWGGEPARGQRPWAVAVDTDLTTTALPDGRRRSLAAGAERWWAGRRVAVRGGARVQTVDDARPAVSGGVSAAPRPWLVIEAHGTRGEDRRDRGWGVAMRLTF
jgi:hypothetical protein